MHRPPKRIGTSGLDLEKAGTPIGSGDPPIAAHTRSGGFGENRAVPDSRLPFVLDKDSNSGINGSMKTTIDIPENELEEAMMNTGAKTKTEAIARAVADFNKRQRLARLAKKLGTFKDFMNREDLKKMRPVS